MAQELSRHYLFIVFIVIQIIFSKCEESVFRIRKCCAENELILEQTWECTDFRLLKMDSHIYHHENETERDFEYIKPGNNGSPPWWFPPDKIIKSKKTNETLREFPKKMEVIAGKGQPCSFMETAFLPIYMRQYDIFDDGSILVYPNQTEGFHTHKVQILFDPLSYCIDRLELEPETTEIKGTQPTLDLSDTVDFLIMLCPCTKATCILKCCQPGMLIDVENQQDNSNACVKNESGEDDWAPNYTKVDSDPRDYFLMHGFPSCKEGEETVIPNQYKVDGHTIYSNGSAHIFGETHMSRPLEFCGENVVNSLSDTRVYNHIVRCYPKIGIKNREKEIRRILYGILFIVGAFFLFLTLLVHGFIPTRNNINDKNLISQTWSLFIGYVSIAVSQLENKLPQSACIFLGFLIQYSFLAAFFWLNVLCFDISWTFSELRIVRGIPNERNHRKFIYYSIYCWLSPAVISIVTAVMEFSPDIPEHFIRPQIKTRCWFGSDSLAILAYFYGPIAVLLSMNVLLFMYTLYRIYQAQKDISTVIKNTNPEKQRFILYMKLLVLMGLPWIAELISWIVGGPIYYWYLTDIINLLRAVFIFAVFCCKKQVLDELKRRFRLLRTPNIRRPSIPRTSSGYLASTQTQDMPKCTNNAVSSL